MFRPILIITALTVAAISSAQAETPASTVTTPAEEVNAPAVPTPNEPSFFSPKTEEDLNKLATFKESDSDLKTVGDE